MDNTNNLNSKKARRPKSKEDFEALKLKFEIAKELGLFEKVKSEGWAALTAQETGKIGGLMNSRLKK